MNIFGIRYFASEELGICQDCRAIAFARPQDAGTNRRTRTTFYRWYDCYLTGGLEALGNRPSRPDRIWDRIPDEVRE